MKEAPAAAARSTCSGEMTVAAPRAKGGSFGVGEDGGEEEVRARRPSKPAGDSAGMLIMVSPSCRKVITTFGRSAAATPRKTATSGQASRHARAWASFGLMEGRGGMVLMVVWWS